MKDKIKILALGGLDSNNCSLYCVEINDAIYIISCGLGYPDKSTPGIDYIISDISYLRANKERVKAYIITHCHDDTMLGLPFIYEEIPAPVYLSKYSMLSLHLFTNAINHLKDLKIDFRLVEPNDDIVINGVEFSLFSITHSVPGAFGIAINTSEGNIIFAEDIIVEYNPFHAFNFNLRKLVEITSKRPTFALMLDSINSGIKGFTSPNHRLASEVRKVLNDCDGRIYVACYYQQAYNYIETINECLSAGRYICFYDEQSSAAFRTLKACGYFDIPASKIINVEDLLRYQDKEIAIIMAGHSEGLYRTISMLALKDISEKRLYIKETDSFVVACPAAPNFEMLGVSILDELYRTDAKIINISRKKLAKMHPSEDDIKFLVSLIKPKFYIPIKGQYKDLMANASIAASMNIGLSHKNIILVENGYIIDFSADNGLNINSIETDKIRVGEILVDGSGVGDVANEIISERNLLAQDGIIVMSCLVSLSEKAIIGGPDIQMRGYLFLKESEQILKKIQSIFIETVEKYLTSAAIFDEKACYKEIKDQCYKFTRRSTLRTPIIEPQLLIVD